MNAKVMTGWIVAVLLLVALFFAWQSLAAARTEVEQLKAEVEALKAKVEALEKELAECGEPLPGPIIDITPNPNGNGNHFNIGGAPAICVPGIGNELNAKAFGTVERLRAIFSHNGQEVPYEVDEVSATIGEGAFVVKRTTDIPPKLSWGLGSTVFVPATTTMPDRHWRDDLCGTMTNLTLKYKTPSNPSGTLVRVEVRANN